MRPPRPHLRAVRRDLADHVAIDISVHLAAGDAAADVGYKRARDFLKAKQHRIPVPQAARIVVVIWTAVLPEDRALRIDLGQDAAAIEGPHGKEALILGTLTAVK
jgi:hypothetical protein